jgi:outer membrane lipoprotein-sorting protein
MVQSLFAAESSDGWKNAKELFQALEKNFSAIRTVQTKFTEEKDLKIFNRTVRLEGRLVLESTGRLAWRVDSPIRYALVLKEDAAFQWDEETRKVQRLPFSGNPVFQTVIAQIQSWFSGRFAELETDYDLQVASEAPLRLVFIPRADRMVAKAIKQVTVSIREDQRYVEQIAIEDVSGDLTTITFHDTVLNEPISADSWEVAPREP